MTRRIRARKELHQGLPQERHGTARHVAMLLSLLAVSACSFIPEYQRPDLPVAGQYPRSIVAGEGSGDRPAVAGQYGQGGAAQGGTDQGAVVQGAVAGQPAVAPADLAWRSFFADARLRRLIELSLSSNRDLRVAALNIEQARALYQVRRADQLPTLSGQAGMTRQHTPAELSPSGRQTTLSQYSVGLGVTAFELDFFGRIRSLSQQALAQFFATEEARRTTQISLVASVASVYLSMVADDALLQLTRETLRSRDESYRLAKLRFDSGVASELDLRQADTLVQQARAAYVQAQRQRAQDENALVLLVGQPLPADLPPPADLAGQGVIRPLPPGLPSDLLTRRPDIRSAEQQLIGANANIGAARAAFFPRISLTGQLGTASLEMSNLFKGGQTIWSFAPQLTVPIFDAGRNRANLEAAKVGREIAVAQYERQVQTAFREVSDALAGSTTWGAQLEALRAQERSERARLKLSQLRYDNGVASYLDLLDAQRSLFAVQTTMIQVQLAQLQNQVVLYKALGGGWQPTDEMASGPATEAAAGVPGGAGQTRVQ